jgi:uncharacterized protein YfaP (DUF2135 family)
MAKSTEGEGAEATTLIFPKKSAYDELVEARGQQKKRSQSASGAYSKVVARLVETEHMDRRAARLLCALFFIEEDEDLHVTFHHLMDGIKKLKLDERAMAAPDFFTAPTPQTVAAGVKSAKGAKSAKGGKGKTAPTTADNVTHIGDAARRVVEQAGGPQS